MKPSSMPTLSLLLLFAFLINLPLLAFSAYEVVDTDGNPVYSDGLYYILPTKDSGGGLKLGRTGTSRCQVTVLRADYNAVMGVPVQFTPVQNLKDRDEIYPDTRLSIHSLDSQVPQCASSSEWWMFMDKILGEKTPFVGIGTANDNPDIIDTVSSGYFKIMESDNGYKLVFCPGGACFDLGLYGVDEDGRRLILPTERAIEVSFVNAKSVQDAEYIKLISG